MSTYELPESIKQVCLITDFREMVTVKVIRKQKSYAIQWTIIESSHMTYQLMISQMEYQDKFKETEIMSTSDKDMLYPTLAWVKVVFVQTIAHVT